MPDTTAAMLGHIEYRRKLDFTDYRPDTIERRRVQSICVTGLGAYENASTFHADVPGGSLSTHFEIPANHLYRNTLVFGAAAGKVIPRLLAEFAGENLTNIAPTAARKRVYIGAAGKTG